MGIFMFFFQRNSCPLFLNHCLSSSSFSVINVRIDKKNYIDKDSTLLCLFPSKSEGSNAISRQKHLELPVVSYLLTELFYIGMPAMRADGRSGVRSRDYQNFSDGRLTKFSQVWSSARARSSAFLALMRLQKRVTQQIVVAPQPERHKRFECMIEFQLKLRRITAFHQNFLEYILRNRVQIFCYLKHLLRVNKRSNIQRAKKISFYRFKYSNIQVKGIVMVLRHEFYYLFQH